MIVIGYADCPSFFEKIEPGGLILCTTKDTQSFPEVYKDTEGKEYNKGEDFKIPAEFSHLVYLARIYHPNMATA